MSNLFGNVSNDLRMQRQTLANKYSAARSNLLILIAFTAINLIMLATNSGTYFLFSASIPYIIVDLSMFFCGMYPEEFYAGELEGMIFTDKTFFIVMMVIAIIILALYFVCWFFSKKNKVGFLTFALIMFSLDTLVMLGYYGFSGASIIDILFHGWVIVILAMGIHAHYKLKKLPAEETVIEGEFTELPTDSEEAIEGEKKNEIPNSVALRPADLDAKSRTLLEYEAFGHKITYRRVKRTNELVIDGDVYGEYSALVEMPHMLTATLDGHTFAAGTDNTSHMYINVDGKPAVQKMRLV